MGYLLKLYTTGEFLFGKEELDRLQHVLLNELEGRYGLEIVDVTGRKLRRGEKVHSTSEISQFLPMAIRRAIVSLDRKDEVLLGLNLEFEV